MGMSIRRFKCVMVYRYLDIRGLLSGIRRVNANVPFVHMAWCSLIPKEPVPPCPEGHDHLLHMPLFTVRKGPGW